MADPFSPVTAVITGQMNAKNAREEQQRQHRYNKELMQLSYGYGQQEQLNAAENTRAGLIAAGINPAVQDGGTFAPASGPSALASTPSPNRYPNFESGLAGLLQLDNIKAQTENLKAQTESVDIKNSQEKSANEIASYLSDTYFEKLSEVAKTPEEKATYDKLATLSKNKGAFGLLSEYIHNLDDKELYDTHYQEYMLKRNLSWIQNSDPNLFNTLAHMPEKQRDQFEATTKMLIEQAKQLASQKDLTDEERNLKLQQIQLTKEQIENLRETTKNLKNTNIMKMIDDGEYGKAFIASILMLLGNVSASKRL